MAPASVPELQQRIAELVANQKQQQEAQAMISELLTELRELKAQKPSVSSVSNLQLPTSMPFIVEREFEPIRDARVNAFARADAALLARSQAPTSSGAFFMQRRGSAPSLHPAGTLGAKSPSPTKSPTGASRGLRWRTPSVLPLSGKRDASPRSSNEKDAPAAGVTSRDRSTAGSENVGERPKSPVPGERTKSIFGAARETFGSIRGKKTASKAGSTAQAAVAARAAASAQEEKLKARGAAVGAPLESASGVDTHNKRHTSFLSADHVGEALKSNAELNTLLLSIERDQKRELEKRGELMPGEASPPRSRSNMRMMRSQELTGSDLAFSDSSLPRSRVDKLKALLAGPPQTRKQQQQPSRLVIHPDTKLKQRWDSAMICAVMLSTITVPFRLAFSIDFEAIMHPVIWIDTVCDVFFGIDIVLNFFSGYRVAEEGGSVATLVVMNHKSVVRNYARTWFIPDVVSTFPFDQVLGADSNAGRINRTLRMFRMFKLLRVFRMSRALDQLETKLTALNPAIFRIIKLVLLLCLLWHWIGCLWFTIRYFDLFDTPNLMLLYDDGLTQHADLAEISVTDLPPFATLEPDVARSYRALLSSKLMDQYSWVYFWGAGTMSGEVVVMPRHAGEAWYTTLVIVLGVFLNAAVIGSASSAFSNLDAESARNKEKLDKLRAFLHFKKTPANISSRVLSYAEFAWTRSRSENERWLMQELPSALRLQVMISLQRKLFTQIELFIRLPVAISCSIISCMKPLICLPDEEIVTDNSEAVGLFFITEGTVSVIRRGSRGLPDQKLSELHDGDFFGENSLLGGLRTDVSMVAMGFVNLQVLYASEFKKLSEAHPEIYEVMTKLRADRQRLIDAASRLNMGGAASGPRIKRNCNKAINSLKLATAMRAQRMSEEISEPSSQPGGGGGANGASSQPASPPQPQRVSRAARQSHGSGCGASEGRLAAFFGKKVAPEPLAGTSAEGDTDGASKPTSAQAPAPAVEAACAAVPEEQALPRAEAGSTGAAAVTSERQSKPLAV